MLRLLIAGALLLLATIGPAAAAQYPRQAVEMTVLFGGSSATIAQVLADAMSKELGVPVAAVSRTGAGGAVGYSFVKSSPPNGYSIVWNSNSISTVFHSGNIDFDYRAFDPVARIAETGPVVTNRNLARALSEHGLAFPVGHCPTVPLSGYLLGGGFGWNAGTWGIACFSVESVDVVMADGELIRANESENTEVFWAARGPCWRGERWRPRAAGSSWEESGGASAAPRWVSPSRIAWGSRGPSPRSSANA